MMDALIKKATTDEFKLFYGLDRELYTFLVKRLCLNPLESIQIMAFWLWLERLGICKVISTILAFSPAAIDQLAEEATACLNCIKKSTPPSSGPDAAVPMTQCLVNRSVTLDFFYNHQNVILKEVQRLVKDVYIPALYDLVEMPQCSFRRSSSQSTRGSQGSAASTPPVYQPRTRRSYEDPLAANFSSLSIQGNASHATAPPAPARAPAPPAPVPVSPAPAPAPARAPVPAPTHSLVTAPARARARAPVPAPARGHTPALAPIPVPPRNRARVNDISEYTRTMFATFSKGYPVTEGEVKHFFTVLLGNCIDSLHMQEVHPYQQSLYARIVFKDQFVIQRILKGQTKAKFTINGKHVWMRRFVPKNGQPYPCGCPSVGLSVCPHQYQY